MADPRLRAALERRYDGPIPHGASIAADFDRPWIEQVRNRKAWSWREVRRLGHLALQARAAWRSAGTTDHEREWKRRRANLAFALRSWATWRDWLRD